MLTKTQAKILELFVSKITERFSILQVSKILKKPYPLIHRSATQLVKDNFLVKDKQAYLSLNYKKNHSELAYIEALRTKEFLKKQKTVALFLEDVLKKVKKESFTFVVFGSAVETARPRDIDLLLIVDDQKDVETKDMLLRNIASSFSINFDVNVVSVGSVYEMLAKRDELNVMNETLNKHIILFGAENYYRLISNAR